MALTIDQMLQKIGEFGRYHWLVIAMVGYAHLTVGGFTVMIVTFITAEPDWMCVKGYNSSICNFTKPIGLTSDDYNARCDMPREAWRFVDEFTSVVTEYDLVCEKSLLLSIAQSCNFIGMFLGLIPNGYLSDRFGRKKSFCFGLFCIVTATWIMVFPKVFVVFIITRIISGFGSGFRNTSGFVLLAEITTDKYRAKATIFPFYFWVASLLMLPGMAYLLPHWRSLLLTTAVCGSPCLFYFWFFPESPRWLLLMGREDEARKELARIAKLNRNELPKETLEKPEVLEKAGNLTHLFYSWTIGMTTLISWDMWFAVALVYYGVSFGSVDLGGNRYFNFALVSLVELPANITARWSADRFGRKKTLIIGLMIAFVSAIITVCIPTNRSNTAFNGGRIAVSILAKFFITMCFTVSYVWSAELFPTYIRTMGLSTSSAAATIGSFAASYVIWLIRVHPLLPYAIMGIICLQASILVSILPETNGQITLETMQDMVDSRAKRTNVEKSPDEQQEKLVKNEKDIEHFVTSV